MDWPFYAFSPVLRRRLAAPDLAGRSPDPVGVGLAGLLGAVRRAEAGGPVALVALGGQSRVVSRERRGVFADLLSLDSPAMTELCGQRGSGRIDGFIGPLRNFDVLVRMRQKGSRHTGIEPSSEPIPR